VVLRFSYPLFLPLAFILHQYILAHKSLTHLTPSWHLLLIRPELIHWASKTRTMQQKQLQPAMIRKMENWVEAPQVLVFPETIWVTASCFSIPTKFWKGHWNHYSSCHERGKKTITSEPCLLGNDRCVVSPSSAHSRHCKSPGNLVSHSQCWTSFRVCYQAKNVSQNNSYPERMEEFCFKSLKVCTGIYLKGSATNTSQIIEWDGSYFCLSFSYWVQKMYMNSGY
jgi:hypothetical protein